jgi:hypothetical protein
MNMSRDSEWDDVCEQRIENSVEPLEELAMHTRRETHIT